MKLYKRCKDICESNDSWKYERAFYYGLAMGVYGDKLLALETQFNTVENSKGVDISLDSSSIIINTTSRNALLKAIEVFGGRWSKRTYDYQPGVIFYEQDVTLPMGWDFHITCVGAPPPSCKVIEVEETIPAQTVKRLKIVCSKGEQVEQASDDEVPTKVEGTKEDEKDSKEETV